MADEVKFGTSGLRGPATAFTPETVGAHVRGFLRALCPNAKALAIGRDLRASSPEIAALVAGAAQAEAIAPINCGVLPTPALAAFALDRAIPAIMVTGSHIPEAYNGLKFYSAGGELRKDEEDAVRAQAQDCGQMPVSPVVVPEDEGAQAFYRQRTLAWFAPDALAGLELGLFAHSAAGSDELARIVEALGARCTVFGQAEAFVAVDTEAVSPDHLGAMRNGLAEHGWDAVISTDGDGDRPLLLDADGRQINGDVLGALAARALGAKTVVTPLTSTSAIETSGWFDRVVRTRIGSPYVVAAMAKAGGEAVVGFEANGGFLVQTKLFAEGRTLAPLPTRDAVLPLLTVLAEANRQSTPIAVLAEGLPPRAMLADRIKDVPAQRGEALVADLAVSRAARAGLEGSLADPVSIDTTDGTRLTLSDGRIVHFRQSGNAPELRCYVEADTTGAARKTLDVMMARLNAFLEAR